MSPTVTLIDLPQRVFPFVIRFENRWNDESDLVSRCLAMFGQGGRLPNLGDRWHYRFEEGYLVIGFRDEADRTLFRLSI